MCPSALTMLLFVGGHSVGDVAFFEKKIRPVLVEHCYSCHSTEAKKQRGGLLLDSRDALRKGGDSGPALVPGDPAKSLLVDVLKYHGEIKMPPKSKLPAAIVADFETWIRTGADDPRDSTTATAKSKTPAGDAAREFWSFQLPRPRTPPKVRRSDWARNEIDAFILSALESKGLAPAVDAEPRVLIRRLTFDLIGLPPTPEEIDAFEKAAAENLDRAIEQTVERLLASPRFGEHWGRHWLDVARFAESLTLRGFVLKDAWRYRDYVIESFNNDVPLDRFTREQIAGDLYEAATVAEKRRGIIATSFLAMGNNNLEEQNSKQLYMDAIDEQLDTLGRAFLGQTIGCARCHDHKFDPISTRDYYALAGIFHNAKPLSRSGQIGKWIETPLPSMAGDDAIRKAEAEIAVVMKEIEALKPLVAAKEEPKQKTTAKGASIDIKTLPGIVVDDRDATMVGDWKTSTASSRFVGAGYVHDDSKGRGDKTLTFEVKFPRSGKYEVRFAYSTGPTRTSKARVTVVSEDGENTVTVNQKLPPTIDDLFVSLGQYRFEKTGQHYVEVSNEDADGHVVADAVVFIPVEDLPKIQPTVVKKAPAKNAPAKNDATAKNTDSDALERFKQLQTRLKELQAKAPRPETSLGVKEEKKIENLRIHIRGSVKNFGEVVPRGFLTAVSTVSPPAIPANESGRRQLAEWIASKDNPLTARVLVNRLWTWTFGDGIVRTVDNFGTTGELPTHPELLDHLALRLIDEGWSAKTMIRMMVLSRTYRQSVDNPAAAKDDPDNRQWSRMNRRRLNAECIRDAMLSASGELKFDTPGPSHGNPGSDYRYVYKGMARSVYMPVFRNAIPEIFEAFDFADPSLSTGKRTASTVAPQALFMMNNPFVIERSQAAAKRLLADASDDDDRVALAYRRILGRPPTPTESRLAREFLDQSPAANGDAWARFTQTLFASIDFRFIQ